MSVLESYLHPSHRPYILVVGDVMLDEYVYCDVVGQSPEDEVALKLRPVRREWKGGGALNVALNLATLAADVVLVGRVGSDASRKILQDILTSTQIFKNVQFLEVVSPDCPTTKKTRYITNKQHRHVVRIDDECMHSDDEARILEEIECSRGTFNRVIVSDYGKGVVTPGVIKLIQKMMGTAFIVDPKSKDFMSYGLAEAITPNELEYAAAKPGYFNKPKFEGATIIETCSAGGARIHMRATGDINQHNVTHQQLVRAREVGDPAGCGDSFIATFAYARSVGATIGQATALGCAAGACAYDHVGVHNVTKEELAKELTTFPYGGEA